jgi:hypothetical protein
MELKEHLDRELTLLQRVSELGESRGAEREEGLMRALYESCYCGYKNYML